MREVNAWMGSEAWIVQSTSGPEADICSNSRAVSGVRISPRKTKRTGRYDLIYEDFETQRIRRNNPGGFSSMGKAKR